MIHWSIQNRSMILRENCDSNKAARTLCLTDKIFTDCTIVTGKKKNKKYLILFLLTANSFQSGVREVFLENIERFLPMFCLKVLDKFLCLQVKYAQVSVHNR